MTGTGPSLILAKHEHRSAAHHNHLIQHQRHQEQHKRQTTIETATAEASAVTEVIQTISVVQQVDVNTDGSTFAVQTLPASNYPSLSLQSAATTSEGSSSTDITTTVPTETSSQPTSSGQATQSLSSSTVLISTSIPSSFSSLTPNANSTTLISSSSSLSTTSSSNSTTLSLVPTTSSFSNAISSTLVDSTSTSSFEAYSSSIITPASGSPYTSIFYSAASSPTTSASTTTSSSLTSTSASSFSGSQTNSASGGGFGNGGTGTATGGGTSTGTATAGGSDGGADNSTPSTKTIVGGVVGGIAGLAALLFLVMFVLRWKKKNGGMLSLGSANRELPSTTSGAIAGGRNNGGNGGDFSTISTQPRSMTERRSLAIAVPAALASLTGKRSSQKTDTISSAGSEKGFYRVSGKKLPSVLQHGGDGFGGGGGGASEPNPNTLSGSSFYPSGVPSVVPPVPNPNTLSGTSFYRDEQGFYGGQSSPILDPSVVRDSGVPMMRPSPARTPVTEHGPFVFADAPASTPPRPDLLGRSHPSQDGSHASRFTEEV